MSPDMKDTPPPTPWSASSASSSDGKTVVGFISDDDMREPGRDAGDLTLKRRPWRRHPTDWRTIVSHPYKGAGTPEDPFVVMWLPQDSENPYRWNPVYKWTLTILGECNSSSIEIAAHGDILFPPLLRTAHSANVSRDGHACSNDGQLHSIRCHGQHQARLPKSPNTNVHYG